MIGGVTNCILSRLRIDMGRREKQLRATVLTTVTLYKTYDKLSLRRGYHFLEANNAPLQRVGMFLLVILKSEPFFEPIFLFPSYPM
jgi:hypothetical protein